MPARATVIAAANPNGGRYSRAKTLQENLKLSAALYSRFDLVFAMLDEADEEKDYLLSEHVMGVHCPGALRCTSSHSPCSSQSIHELLIALLLAGANTTDDTF